MKTHSPGGREQDPHFYCHPFTPCSKVQVKGSVQTDMDTGRKSVWTSESLSSQMFVRFLWKVKLQEEILSQPVQTAGKVAATLCVFMLQVMLFEAHLKKCDHVK